MVFLYDGNDFEVGCWVFVFCFSGLWLVGCVGEFDVVFYFEFGDVGC